MTLPRPLLVLAILLGSTGAGCRQPAPVEPHGIKIGLVLADGTSGYQEAVRQAAAAYTREKGLELTVLDARGRASEQTLAIEQLLQQNVSVILLSPVDPVRLGPVLQKAASARTFVVTVDHRVPGADVATAIVFNQELVGQLSAEYLGSRLPSGGRVGVLGAPQTREEQERLDAFRAHLRQRHPEVRVVARETAREEAGQRPAVERLLRGQPQVDAILALDDAAALAAAGSIRDRRRAAAVVPDGEPFVIGYGGLPEALLELKLPDSPLTMIVATFPQRLGTVGARQAWRIVSNQPTVPSIVLPVLPLTRENLHTYPGWSGPPPRERDLAIPWPSTLRLVTEKD